MAVKGFTFQVARIQSLWLDLVSNFCCDSTSCVAANFKFNINITLTKHNTTFA